MPSLLEKAAQLSNQDFDSIPIIDLTNATSPVFEERKALAEEIQYACLTAGFFYIKNHPVPEPLITQTFHQSSLFFSLPTPTKSLIHISRSNNFRGYMPLLSENTDPKNKGDMHEAFNLGLEGEVGSKFGVDMGEEEEGMGNLWLGKEDWEGAEEFRKTILEYYTQIIHLGHILFPLLALALDLPEDFFTDKIKRPAAIQRLLYYPGLGGERGEEGLPGIGEHTDYEVFTVLRQDEIEGLEVQNLSGKWIRAKYIPGTFVINIGDQLARWTNDVFRSTKHRALPPPLHTPRYSIPTFWGCDYDVPLIPIPTCVSAERPAKYEVVKAGEYVRGRLEETYRVEA